MQCVDIFSGCGGLTLGLHQAGIKGILAIEKNPDAFLTLKHNLIDRLSHFTWPDWFPIKAHDIDEVTQQYREKFLTLRGTVDLVAGGPPCQGFSLAGRRRSNDKRNAMVNSYIEVIKLLEPNFILFENVKGFTIPFQTKRTSKKYSSEVVLALKKLGYQVHYQLIDFSTIGVPQRRTRFILFGVRNKKGVPDDFAQKFFERIDASKNVFCKAKGLLDSMTSLKDAISDLCQSNGTHVDKSFPGFKFGLYGEITSPYQKVMRNNLIDNSFPDSHRFANHTKVVTKRFAAAIKKQMSPSKYRAHFELKKTSTKCLSCDAPTPTLTTLPDDYIHYAEPRILTVREYARIQSFPDDFQFMGKYTTGGLRRALEVPRYSQIGNAIPPFFGDLAGQILMELNDAYNC